MGWFSRYVTGNEVREVHEDGSYTDRNESAGTSSTYDKNGNLREFSITKHPLLNYLFYIKEIIMAVIDYGWYTIAPNGQQSVFCHGFQHNQAASFSIVVFPGTGEGVPFPAAHASLSQGEYFKHVDGTFAQKVYIKNLAPFNSCNVHLLAQVESF